MSKVCCRCHVEKDLAEFAKDRTKKSGYGSKCKACTSELARIRRENNPEAAREAVRRYVEKYPDRVAATRKASFEKHRERRLEDSRQWKRNNATRLVEYGRQWREANYERFRETARARALRWFRKNPEYARDALARRRAAKQQRSFYLTAEHKKQMRDIYAEAVRLTKATGIKHHVDHIVPLRGETVSGLHVPWNLQVLTAHENQSKGNRHPFDTQ